MSLSPAYTPLNWVNLNPGAAAITILNQPRTGEQTRALQGSIVVTGLSGAGSLLTVTRSIGGVAQIAVPFVVPIGQTSIEIPIAAFVARDSLAVGFTLRSDNAADSAVSGTTTLWPVVDNQEIAAAVVIQSVQPHVIHPARVWQYDDRSRSRPVDIVTVKPGFVGRLAFAPALNDGAAVATVTSVTLNDSATGISELGPSGDYTQATFKTAALATGVYEARAVITTTDGETLPLAATLRVE